MKIAPASPDPPVRLAATELGGYLSRLLDRDVPVLDGSDPAATLQVGCAADIAEADPPAVPDPRYDDAIAIDVDATGAGFVAGNSPRATLVAAYRYLRALGCTWIRPGPDGEFVPTLAFLPPVSITERPAARHRGVHIGGTDDEADLRAYIDWIPKVGYNAAIIEFHEGETFKKGRDRRAHHPAEPSDPLSDACAQHLYEVAIDELERRGLVIHTCGHNWTGAAIDMFDAPREDDMEAVPDGMERYLAQIDGERTLYGRGPLDTELCYANSTARQRFVDAVIDYTADHDEIDVVHVWLSDGHNNHCACADCRGTRPSDWYVRLLNELDAAMTAAGLDQRVAFLAYTDLLWPPDTERFEHPDRFVLMFAPIRRDYVGDYASIEPHELPPYERNDATFPSNVSENVAFLRAWQELFDGDGFVFDYHYWMAHYRDPGEVGMAELVATDMGALADLGLHGSVSCNAHRVFFPTGLGMHATAARLWDPNVPFYEVLDRHLEAAVGPDHERIREYLEAVSSRFDQPYLAGHDVADPAAVAARFEEVPELVDDVRPLIADRLAETSGTRRESWRRLAVQADVAAGLARALAAEARGEDGTARELWTALKDDLRERADECIDFFDLAQFERAYDRRFS